MMIRTACLIALLFPFPVMADTLTTTRVIRANAVIDTKDISVAEFASPGALTNESDVVGMEARITLYPGRPILPSHVGPAALVTRNQPVILVYTQGGLSIVAEGRALSRGGLGDEVRVMNLTSKATLVGQVRADGRVEVSGGGSIK